MLKGLAETARREAGNAAIRIGLRGLAATLGVIATLCSLGLLIAAATAALAERIGFNLAALIVAAALVVLALGAFALAFRRRRRPSAADPQANAVTLMAAFAFGFARGLARKRR